MPEGHTLHRLARDVNDAFAGSLVAVDSPQGRFAGPAAVLNGHELLEAQAWGKHLFVDFDVTGPERIVHIHLGLYGKVAIGRSVPEVPEAVGQLRLRIIAAAPGNKGGYNYAELRGATTCELIGEPGRAAILDRVGPDPIRPDADPERAWLRIHRSRTSIAQLLMDQSVFAGVGNIYRAELLYRHRLDPLRPGNTLQRRQFDALWADLVVLMADGVRTGRIDTVRPEHLPEAMGRAPRQDRHGGEVYVYRRAGQPCLVCGRRVRTTELAGRNLYWCSHCQPTFRSRARGV